ncbi:Gigasin-3a [Porphyridium purpureum]|uniref:Gigasin-3a n=1 Tax=Porphyridium purpureum TaxID=35688 RepID=A0A5J4Z7D3_PORPP|nr:Gigasin-3a [Porphyridium purpureum]|eukprot:POR1192..scf295_1
MEITYFVGIGAVGEEVERLTMWVGKSVSRLLSTLFVVSLLVVPRTGVWAQPNVEALTGTCKATVIASYVQPPLPYDTLIPELAGDDDVTALYAQLVDGECAQPDAGQVCVLNTAIGSGLAFSGGKYYGLTDRGPNQDCGDLFALDPIKYAAAGGKTGKGFPVKRFAPSIVEFSIQNGEIVYERFINLRDSMGNLISGISNTANDDVPYAADCVGEPLPLDPNGVDTEDIVIIEEFGVAVLVEEYSPSVLLVRLSDGEVLERYVPGNIAPQLEGASYPIVGNLPDIFSLRRNNRGFEFVAKPPSESYIIAGLQSPMLAPNGASENNLIIRMVKMMIEATGDASRPVRLVYEGQYFMEATGPRGYVEDDLARNMKMSGAFFNSEETMVVLERARNEVKLLIASMDGSATNLDATAFANTLQLEIQTNGRNAPENLGLLPVRTRLLQNTRSDKFGGTSNFPFTDDKQEGFVLRGFASDMIQDTDFGLEMQGFGTLRVSQLGRDPVSGRAICEPPAFAPSPSINVNPTNAVTMERIGLHVISTTQDSSAAEIVDVDKTFDSVLTANAESNRIDRFQGAKGPVTPTKTYELSGFAVNSISVCNAPNARNGWIAAAMENDQSGQPGRFVVFDRLGGIVVNQVTGVQPDMVGFSEDCNWGIMAIEAEGVENEGSVFIYDFVLRRSRVADFRWYDDKTSELRMNGIRLVEAPLFSLDAEPEYGAFFGTDTAVFVLQENNAFAVIDLIHGTAAELKSSGYVDHSAAGFGLDASDRDDMINIRNYDHLFGMRQGDTFLSHVWPNGQTYFVLANEGDAKDSEELRVKDIGAETGVDMSKFEELGYTADALLGRLQISKIMGVVDGRQEQLYSFGSRSFSIYDQNLELVFDSGEWIERIAEATVPTAFNAEFPLESDNTLEDEFDGRSDNKGPEPEGLALFVSETSGAVYLVVGAERLSQMFLYDVTDPASPVFVTTFRDTPINVGVNTLFASGDPGIMDPEGMKFDGNGLLHISGAVSGVVSTWKFMEGAAPATRACENDGMTCDCSQAVFGECAFPEGIEDVCRVGSCAGWKCACAENNFDGTQVVVSSAQCAVAEAEIWVPVDPPAASRASQLGLTERQVGVACTQELSEIALAPPLP